MVKKPPKKVTIREKGLDAIADFFDLDIEKIRNLEPKELKILSEKAKLGMSFEREMGLQTRSTESKTIRVMTLISADKSELKRLLKKTLPQYYPK